MWRRVTRSGLCGRVGGAAVIGGRRPRVVGTVVAGVAGAQAGSAARRLKAFATAAVQGQSAGRCSVRRRAWRGGGAGGVRGREAGSFGLWGGGRPAEERSAGRQ